jgi:hypothetical protein
MREQPWPRVLKQQTSFSQIAENNNVLLLGVLQHEKGFSSPRRNERESTTSTFGHVNHHLTFTFLLAKITVCFLLLPSGEECWRLFSATSLQLGNTPQERH